MTRCPGWISHQRLTQVVFHFERVRLLFKPGGGRPAAEGGDQVAVCVENFYHRVRCKLIAAGPEFHGSGNFVRSDENAARVVSIERECERVIVPASSVLPNSVAGATQSGTRTRTNTIFRHRTALIKGEQTWERRTDWVAGLTINWRNHRSPHALDGSLGRLSRGVGKRNGQSRNHDQRAAACFF
jgi:hypothetical protein